MKRKMAGLFIVSAVLAAVALVGLHSRSAPNDKAPGAKVLPRPDIIGTATPQRRDFAETCHWFGKVESRDKTRIIALETGRIVSIIARDGMSVAKGELLFTIGGPLIDSRREALRGKLAAFQERIAIAERMVKIKRDAVSRQFAKHEELASAEDAFARLKAELESARQEVQRLQDAARLCATVAGVFTNRKVSIGQEVQKGDDLAEIISQNHIYIAAALFPKSGEIELEKKRAVINLPGGNSIQGTIYSALPQRTPEGASVVWIKGPDLALSLRPNQTVTGTVVVSVHKRVLAIPQNAITRDEQERAYVFLKYSSGYRKEPVKTGIISDGWVEIISGLKEGDVVVIRGAYELLYRRFNKMYKAAD